jgi:hypothetical protein
LTLDLIGLCQEKLFRPFFECPEKNFSTSPPLANIFGRNSSASADNIDLGPKKIFAAGHHRLSQGNSSRHPPNKKGLVSPLLLSNVHLATVKSDFAYIQFQIG